MDIHLGYQGLVSALMLFFCCMYAYTLISCNIPNIPKHPASNKDICFHKSITSPKDLFRKYFKVILE